MFMRAYETEAAIMCEHLDLHRPTTAGTATTFSGRTFSMPSPASKRGEMQSSTMECGVLGD